MNSPLSYSELLSAFLDGELDESTTTALFYTLAHDQDLQLEMRQLIAIGNGFQGGLLTPPDTLRDALQRRLGFPEAVLTPIATATSASPAAGIVQGKPFLMFVSALAASLLTFLLIHTNPEASRPVPQMPQLDMFLPAQAHRQIAPQVSQLAVHEAKRQRGQMSGMSRSAIAAQEQSSADQFPTDEALRIGSTEYSNVVLLTPEHPAAQSAMQIQPVLTDEVPTLSAESEALYERSFSLSLRGFSGRSFPAIDLEPLAEPPVNNIAAGLLYQLDEHHTLGVEVGQENLLQRYDGVLNGTDIVVEQNYLALWGGVSYRYTLTPQQALQPFGGIVLGGTTTGPMARLTLGTTYRLGSVSLTAGIEGMLHAFRYQNRWFSTQKINATYGVSFHF